MFSKNPNHDTIPRGPYVCGPQLWEIGMICRNNYRGKNGILYEHFLVAPNNAKH